MESRILKIWDVDEHGKPASKYREIYCGDYFERYKVTTKAMKLMCPEWKEFRIGFIRDDGTGRVAVFRQLVKSRNDPRPTDILMGRGGPKSGEDVLEAGSTDPQFAVPAGPQVSCYVCDFSERDPTEEEKEIIAASRRGPPPNSPPAASAKTESASQPATATDRLEAEIIRILSRDFPNIKARPTATEFYQEHIINGRTMAGLARAKGWKTRTMKARKANIETHLTQKLGMPVDLDKLKTAPRKSGKIIYTDPGVIERTYSDDTQHNKI